MSLRKYKKDLLADFEDYYFRLEGEDNEGVEHAEDCDPWNEKNCFEEIRIDQKIIVKSFIDGILLAHRWGGDMFECPKDFPEVLKDIGQSVQFLRFNFKDGKILMSINELVDKHMRRWIMENQIMVGWIKDGVLTSRAILRNACNALCLYQGAFHYRYKIRLKAVSKEIDQRFAEIRNESGESGEFPATPSSQLLSAVEIIPAKPIPQTPSGLQPSV